MVWMTIMLVAPVFGVLLYIFVEFRSSAVAQCKAGAHARNDEETLDTG